MNVVLYGDSNTYGLTPFGGRYENRYSNILKNQFSEFNIYEEGLVGRTTIYDDYRPNRRGASDVYQTLSKYDNINLLIIMLGTNDYKIGNANSLIDVKKGMDTLISEIKRHSAISKILIISPIALSKNIEKLDKEFDYNSYLLSNESYKAYKEIADDNDALFFDAKLIARPGEDGEHLEEEGHLAIANKIASIIEGLKR